MYCHDPVGTTELVLHLYCPLREVPLICSWLPYGGKLWRQENLANLLQKHIGEIKFGKFCPSSKTEISVIVFETARSGLTHQNVAISHYETLNINAIASHRLFRSLYNL